MTTVRAKVEGSYVAYYEEADEGIRYSLLECPECTAPILMAQDYLGYYDEQSQFGEPRQIYPQTARRSSSDVPEIVRTAFHEAKLSLQCGAYMASAVMCRRALEAICLDQGAQGRTLLAQLGDLRGKGAIDPSLSEWADALRITGNAAAHAAGVPTSRQDARDTLDFTEAIIDYLYIFKQRFEAFKQRREAEQGQGA